MCVKLGLSARHIVGLDKRVLGQNNAETERRIYTEDASRVEKALADFPSVKETQEGLGSSTDVSRLWMRRDRDSFMGESTNNPIG